MPIYEYACQTCGERTEAIQQLSDPPLKKCPSCGGKLRKLLSAPAFQFKGSGWYVTDYARKQESKTDGAESKSSEAGSESKESASKDSGGAAEKTEKSDNSEKSGKTASGETST